VEFEADVDAQPDTGDDSTLVDALDAESAPADEVEGAAAEADLAPADVEVDASAAKPGKPDSKADPKTGQKAPGKDPAAGPKLNTFRLLDGEFPNIEELKYDKFYDNLEEQHLQKMDPYSKRILHNLRIEFTQAKREMEGYKSKLDDDYRSKLSELAERERAVAMEGRRLHAWVTDPKIQELLKPVELDGDLDPLTAEGQKKLIANGIRETFAQTIGPANEAYEKIDRQARYLNFLGEHPDMNDEFKVEMSALVKDRAAAGVKISLEDAYELTKGRRLIKDSEARKAAELRARQASQARVSRTASGAAPVESGVPSDVRKKGAVAIAQWMQKHPKAAKAERDRRMGS
jgi:hypothetical protein